MTECTDMLCDREAEYAYWMDGFFSRVRNPTHDLLEDGDLSPYVCEKCKKRMAAGPHYDAERFRRPEETLIPMTDGGSDPADDPFACSGCGCAIGEYTRIRGPGYCQACLDEMGFATEGEP